MPNGVDSSLNVLMFAIGSAGDIHPCIGLGEALAKRGHRVTFVSNSYFEPIVRTSGLDFISNGSREEYLARIQDPTLWQFGKGFKVLFSLMLDNMRSAYTLIQDKYLPGRTVVVAPGSVLGARIAHERLGVPLVGLQMQPAMLRSLHEQPGVMVPEYLRRFLPPLRKLLLASLDRWVLDPPLLPQVNAFRQELGLRPVARLFNGWALAPQLIVALFPEWFAPPQPDWPAQLRFTGFPLFDEREVRRIPDHLNGFLDTHQPPVVFTLGSAMRFAKTFFQISAETCRILGCPGLLVTQFADQIPAPLPDGVVHCEYAPFSSLFPRARAVVHHGGIGTIAQALRAGIPQLVTPMNFDQPDNAVRLRKLGVGDSIQLRDYKAPVAARKLEALLKSPQVADNTRRAAAKFTDTNPLGDACRLIESVIASPMQMRAGGGM